MKTSQRMRQALGSVKEKYEAHPLLWFLGIMLACFLAGIGFLQASLYITNRVTVDQNHLATLENETAAKSEDLRNLRADYHRLTIERNELEERHAALIKEVEKQNVEKQGDVLIVYFRDATEEVPSYSEIKPAPVFDVTLFNRGSSSAILSGVDVVFYKYGYSGQGDAEISSLIIDRTIQYTIDITKAFNRLNNPSLCPMGAEAPFPKGCERTAEVPLNPPAIIPPGRALRFSLQLKKADDDDVELYLNLRLGFRLANAPSVHTDILKIFL